MNAIKFKLRNISDNEIRYEVIYKNLIRDIRKYYSKEFNEETNYINEKRGHDEEFFIVALKHYIA